MKIRAHSPPKALERVEKRKTPTEGQTCDNNTPSTDRRTQLRKQHNHTMELRQNSGRKSITNNAQTDVGLPNNGHKTKGNGSNNQEAVGSNDLVFWTQAS